MEESRVPYAESQSAMDGDIPYQTIFLVLGEPETMKRNIDPGGRIALYRWHCGCRAVEKNEICDVKWCLRHARLSVSSHRRRDL